MSGQPILIIHPESVGLERLTADVRGAGYEVVQARSGADAVQQLMRHKAVMILYAIRCNNLGDLGAFARVRELPGGKEMPIIALYDPAEEKRARGLGAALSIRHFLASPAETVPLINLVAQLMPAVAQVPEHEGEFAGDVTVQELRIVQSRVITQNHFERLGVGEAASPLEVKRAYRKLMTRYAPEAIAGSEPRRLMRDIYDALGQAYRTLKDDAGAARYRFDLAKRKTNPPPPQRPNVVPPPSRPTATGPLKYQSSRPGPSTPAPADADAKEPTPDTSTLPLFASEDGEEASPPTSTAETKPPPLFAAGDKKPAPPPMFGGGDKKPAPPPIFGGGDKKPAPPPLFAPESPSAAPPTMFASEEPAESPSGP